MNGVEAWQELGSVEPYYSVLTNPAFMLESLTSEHLKDFFASGDREIENLLRAANAVFPLDLPFDRVLDFGCGVGRLTIPLARRARQVIAVDAAESMLSRARQHCSSENVNNVEFLSLDDFPAAITSPVDLVCAHLVLQHIPPSLGRRVVCQLVSLLAPGGVFSVDVTFHRQGSRFLGVGRWLRARSRLVHAIASRLKGSRPLPYMQMNTYDLNSILHVLTASGLSMSIITVSSDGPFLSARIISQRLR